MGLWSKLTRTDPETRSARDRARRSREIRTLDTRTATWLRNGGLAPRKKQHP